MKKIIGVIIFAMLLALVLVGCKKEEEEENVFYGTEEEWRQMMFGSRSSEVEDVSSELEAFEVTESYAKENKMICLCRDGKLYGLAPTIIREENGTKKAIRAESLVDDSRVMVAPELSEIRFNKETDEIRDYASTEFEIYKGKFIGDTIFLYKSSLMDGRYVIMDDEISPDVPMAIDERDLQVKDKNGAVLENFSKLSPGEEYEVSWQEGMDIKKIHLNADWQMYSIDKNPTTTIEGELNEGGYAVFSLKSLPPGSYFVGKKYYTIAPIIIE